MLLLPLTQAAEQPPTTYTTGCLDLHPSKRSCNNNRYFHRHYLYSSSIVAIHEASHLVSFHFILSRLVYTTTLLLSRFVSSHLFKALFFSYSSRVSLFPSHFICLMSDAWCLPSTLFCAVAAKDLARAYLLAGDSKQQINRLRGNQFRQVKASVPRATSSFKRQTVVQLDERSRLF